ncbi:hypothetical protein [Corynebacterium nuruki]|uniref:hypothetical protein n=1 Tax=Corynebacterium nuruki TaxID=1032851 RepID=UPI0039BF1208
MILTHTKVAGRQKALWFTAVPLTAVATLLALTSQTRPATGGVEDLAFTGQMIAIFTGIAYAAAFPGFLTGSVRLGMSELEASTPVSPAVLRAAKVAGAFLVVVTPSFVVLLLVAARQTVGGRPVALFDAVLVTLTVVAPAALSAMALSGFAGALLPRALGRIAALLVWLLAVFSSPLVPLPTVNGTVFTFVGDAVVSGFFHTDPIYEAQGPLPVDGSASGAVLSLLWQACLILILLVVGTALAQRSRNR